MDFFSALEVSASGLAAQRVRMNVVASNVANASTTSTEEGGPYRRKDVVLSSGPLAMPVPGQRSDEFANVIRTVSVSEVVDDTTEGRVEYDPGHPDADAGGYVEYPNINVVEEMVDMITASRAYEAGITTMRASVQMADRALSIGR